MLLGFVVGADARHLRTLSTRERHRRVLAALERLFGAQAARPTALIEQDWSREPWTRGCYAGYFPPGRVERLRAALRAPVGRLHWAGTETAEVFNGYMDGAVRSGERAAREVGAEL